MAHKLKQHLENLINAGVSLHFRKIEHGTWTAEESEEIKVTSNANRILIVPTEKTIKDLGGLIRI